MNNYGFIFQHVFIVSESVLVTGDTMNWIEAAPGFMEHTGKAIRI